MEAFCYQLDSRLMHTILFQTFTIAFIVIALRGSRKAVDYFYGHLISKSNIHSDPNASALKPFQGSCAWSWSKNTDLLKSLGSWRRKVDVRDLLLMKIYTSHGKQSTVAINANTIKMYHLFIISIISFSIAQSSSWLRKMLVIRP